MREVLATFTISEDDNNAGVQFKVEDKVVEWNDLSKLEQIKMLNAWAGMWELFGRFLKA